VEIQVRRAASTRARAPVAVIPAAGRFAALLSVALFDFFFVPPRFTFAVSDLHYVVTFGVMLRDRVVISWLAERVRAEAVSAEAREGAPPPWSP